MFSTAKLVRMKCNLKSIRLDIGMTQREVAAVFGQTASNVSHYENGKQELPPACARALIEAARVRGREVTFDEIYAARKAVTNTPAPEPRQAEAPPVRALACTTQSVRLTADRRDADRRDLVRRAEPVDAPQLNQLPLALAGEPRQEAA